MKIPSPQRGGIYWVELPHDPKMRPALVISLDARNRLANDVMVIPISGILREAPTHVFLEKGEGGLTQASMAKCEQLTTVPKSVLADGPLGTLLSRARLEQVERGVLRAIGIPA